MKTHSSQWYEVKVRTAEPAEDGTLKDKITPYVVEAFSFTEAENRATEQASAYTSGAIEVADIKKARYKEIFLSDDTTDSRWYKATLQYITINEKCGKEKLTNAHHLVQAPTLQGAVKNIEEVMRPSMQDYTIASVAETPIMDIFTAQDKDEEAQEN